MIKIPYLSALLGRNNGPTDAQIEEIRKQAEEERATWAVMQSGKLKQPIPKSKPNPRMQFKTGWDEESNGGVAVLDPVELDGTGEGNPDSELLLGDESGLFDFSDIEDSGEIDAPVIEEQDSDEYGALLIETGQNNLADINSSFAAHIEEYDARITQEEAEIEKADAIKAEAERIEAIAGITNAVVAHKEKEEAQRAPEITIKSGEAAPVTLFRSMFNLLGLNFTPSLPAKITNLYNEKAENSAPIVMDRRNQGGKISTIERKRSYMIGENNLAPVEALSVVKEISLRKGGQDLDLWVKKAGKAKKLREFNPKNVHDIAMMELACETQGIGVKTTQHIEKLRTYKTLNEDGSVKQDNAAIFAEAREEYNYYLQSLRTNPDMARQSRHVRRMDEVITEFPQLNL